MLGYSYNTLKSNNLIFKQWLIAFKFYCNNNKKN